MSSDRLERCRPGDVLSVGLAVFEASVEDPDQPVGHGAKRLVMGGPSVAASVVVPASAG